MKSPPLFHRADRTKEYYLHVFAAFNTFTEEKNKLYYYYSKKKPFLNSLLFGE